RTRSYSSATRPNRRPGRSAVRVLVVGAGRDARDDGLLRALVQALPAAPDGGQELLEIHLERGQDAVGPVLHLELRLTGLAPRVVDDLLRLPLGQLHDLGLGGFANRLLACLAEHAVTLALGLGQHLLPLLDDPASLLDLVRDRGAHLVEDLVDLVPVDANLVRERDGLGVVHQVVELVDENEYVHPASLLTWADGSAGPRHRVKLAEALRDGGR